MKVLIVLLFLAPGWAWAAPFVCFTGKSPAATFADVDPYAEDQPLLLARWNPSCEAMDQFETGLQATSLVLSGTGFALACTGIGLPATVWLEGAALGTSALGLIVGQLPCDNRAKDHEIKALAESVVCDELAKQGIRCSFR